MKITLTLTAQITIEAVDQKDYERQRDDIVSSFERNGLEEAAKKVTQEADRDDADQMDDREDGGYNVPLGAFNDLDDQVETWAQRGKWTVNVESEDEEK